MFGMDQALCFQGAQQHQSEQRGQHVRELQPDQANISKMNNHTMNFKTC